MADFVWYKLSDSISNLTFYKSFLRQMSIKQYALLQQAVTRKLVYIKSQMKSHRVFFFFFLINRHILLVIFSYQKQRHRDVRLDRAVLYERSKIFDRVYFS